MRRKQRLILHQTLIFLLFFNIITLSVYFFLHLRQPNEQNYQYTPPSASNHIPTIDENLKPWPFLPSYLPWTPDPTPLSCESYFGHGFSRTIHLLGSEPIKMTQPFIKIHYSETLTSSIWELGIARMHPDRISMSRGGEELKSVIGRNEDDELPKFEEGAFEIEGKVGEYEKGKVVNETFLNWTMPVGLIQVHTMRNLIDSIRVVEFGSSKCDQWIEEPTILVTRFEYANLFHTVTDWYSAYAASRVAKLPHRPHLVFIDGHCKTQLEETWRAMFSSVRYAKEFLGSVCFRQVILSPLGYETALFKGLYRPITCQGTQAIHFRKHPDNLKTSRIHEFGEMITSSLGLLNPPSKPFKNHTILFIRRENYLAHPRHNGRVESRLSNEQEVFDAIDIWASAYTKCKLKVVNGLFAHMHMKEQLQAIQEASVVVGAHGAGLTHLVAARPDTVVLEIVAREYMRPHFALISQWKGLQYHAIYLLGYYARPEKVIDELSKIVGSLPC